MTITNNSSNLAAVHLQRSVKGAASADVRLLEHSLRAVMWIDVNSSFHRGALSAAASEVIAYAAKTARDQGLPLVMSLGSSGADIIEGVAALHGWGQAAHAIADCSGVVPVITIVNGPAVSGPALLIGLSDFVIMTQDSYAFVSGPTMVAEFTGIEISNEELGGTDAHARQSGVASLVVKDAQAALDSVEHLLTYLPNNVNDIAVHFETDDPVDRLTPEAGKAIPDSSTGSYDVRKVIRILADDQEMFELRERWAPNVITAFITIGGESIGVVANQPMSLAGTLDIAASQKAARFVSFCDSFNIALLTLVDTPGFYPGKDLEWRGMIRHGGQLVFAYARATVPRVCVILRKSYGGAYIVMDSKTMGNDLCLAWPTAELAVMGAGQAAAILQRRATAKERAAFESDYSERLLNPYIAAERGYIDAVIDPADTRREIAAAFQMLREKRERLISRKHDNTPL
ncbi:MAG: carboxyl transferase domain-containing protein [Ilumatobacteraceae bacterium]